jgi:hypothetical protein
MRALAVVAALGAPTVAGAQDIGFTYIEGGYIAGFVNDVEESGTFTDNGTFELETDSGGGGFIGGGWEFRENMHLFGEYSSASQELEISDGIDTDESDFDVVRWRVGVGYAYPYSPTASFYGRLSFDSAEFKDVRRHDLDGDASVPPAGPRALHVGRRGRYRGLRHLRLRHADRPERPLELPA